VIFFSFHLVGIDLIFGFFSNGVGAPVAMSIADSEDAQDIGMDDSQLSGWKNTQTAANNDDSKSSENKDDNEKEEGLCYPDPISFPPKGTSQSTSHTKLPDSVVPHHFSAVEQNSLPSKVGPHQTSSAQKSEMSNSPMKAQPVWGVNWPLVAVLKIRF
jgi:hypothetical protein